MRMVFPSYGRLATFELGSGALIQTNLPKGKRMKKRSNDDYDDSVIKISRINQGIVILSQAKVVYVRLLYLRRYDKRSKDCQSCYCYCCFLVTTCF